MKVEQQPESIHGRVVFIAGYSQSGKSTRINCLYNQLMEALAAHTNQAIRPSYGNSISIKFISQSRHIVPHYRDIRSRGGETSFMSVDYTGQDHQAAYYFLRKIYEIIESIKSRGKSEGIKEVDEDIRSIIKGIRKVSKEIVLMFRSPEVGLSIEEFNRVILSPFDHFRSIASKYKINLDLSYLDVIRSVIRIMITRGWEEFIMELTRYGNPEESIKYLENYLRGIFEIIELNRLSSIRVEELNRVLCRMDTLTTNITDDKKYRRSKSNSSYGWLRNCDESNDIMIDGINEYGWLRGIITGPLLAYLFLGLLIDSWTTIILMPVDFEKWYRQLMRTYLVIEDREKESRKDEVNQEVRNAMINYINHFVEIDTEIGRAIRRLCSELIYQYAYENKLDIDNIDNAIKNICDNLCKNVSSSEDVEKYICGQKLITLWGEALAKIYHYELINVLLNLYLEYSNHMKDQNMDRVFIFDLTYCEDKKFIDGVRAILSSEYLPSGWEEMDYIIRFRNIINSLMINEEHKVKIYFIPSTIRGGADPATSICTPFEAISIICLSERAQEVKVRNSNTGEEISIECNSVLRNLSLDWISKII